MIGALGGSAAALIGMPLPWMLGSMIGVSVAALAGAPITSPSQMRSFVVPVIGVMLGSSIQPDMLDRVATFAGTLVILPVALALVAGVSFVTYRYLGKYDTRTAFFCAMPGGLTEMVLIGGDAGADERKISLAHGARVMLVIIFVGLFFGVVFGVRSNGTGGSWTAMSALSPADMAILLACALLGVPLARRLHLPVAAFFGPMLLSGIAHITQVVTVAPPSLLVIAAQVVVGTIIGGRFVGTTFQELVRDMGVAVVATGAMVATAFLASVVLVSLVPMPLSQAFLAYAPGGLTEMSLLALAIGGDVAFVSITHIVRITFVIGIAPFLFRKVFG